MSKFTRTRYKRVRTKTNHTKKKNDVVALFTNHTNNHTNNNGKKVGRKSKLTPRTLQALTEAIKNDMTIKRACLLCGINPVTYFGWKQSGEIERERIAEIIENKKKAAIDAERLNPLNSLVIEDFVEKELNKLKPNKYFNFLISIKQAEAEAELANLNAIQNARDGAKYLVEKSIVVDKEGNVIGKKETEKYQVPQWTAAAWLLERRHPDLYGRKMTHDGNLNIDHEIKIGIAIIPETPVAQNWQAKYSPKDIDGKPRQIISEG
jgi:predicted  nucleic acid-binding Zn-ribbon protein